MSGPCIVCILQGGPMLTMPTASGRQFTFEMHPYMGPVRCHGLTGEPTKHDFAKNSDFWPLFYRWDLGGAKVDEYHRCLLPPLTPELHMAVACALEFGAVAARAIYRVGR